MIIIAFLSLRIEESYEFLKKKKRIKIQNFKTHKVLVFYAEMAQRQLRSPAKRLSPGSSPGLRFSFPKVFINSSA